VVATETPVLLCSRDVGPIVALEAQVVQLVVGEHAWITDDGCRVVSEVVWMEVDTVEGEIGGRTVVQIENN
jgi:hypothetical protein